MLEAAGNVDTGLVTFAARDSEFGGHTIRHGDILGLNNGKLEYIEKDPVAACVKVTRSLSSKRTSFITLIYGEGITQEQAEEAKRRLEDKLHSDVEITLVAGGQPVVLLYRQRRVTPRLRHYRQPKHKAKETFLCGKVSFCQWEYFRERRDGHVLPV